MTLTERAAARVRELVEGAERPIAGVRVGVKKGGCAGMEYTLEPVETPAATDDVVTGHGATVYVDPKAVLFLFGSVMDYETTKLRSGFTFQNRLRRVGDAEAGRRGGRLRLGRWRPARASRPFSKSCSHRSAASACAPCSRATVYSATG
jgi:iron-sulfur cluster assembly protein